MKVAIFGGSFDPIHIEHVNIARESIKEFGLDKLIIIPTGKAPHKQNLEPFKTRLEMVKIAFKDVEKTEISEYESKKNGTCYAIDTINYFKKKYREIYYIIGDDSFKDLHRWYKYDQILKNAKLILSKRNLSDAEIDQLIKKYNLQKNNDIYILEYIPTRVSSSKLKFDIATNNIDFSEIQKDVYIYAKKNTQYGKISNKCSKLKENLSKSRYQHSINSAKIALELNKNLKLNINKVLTACIFHDCAKPKKYIDIAKEICIRDNYNSLHKYILNTMTPATLHQYLGPLIAKEIYDINDKDVIKAISTHCTGDDNMNNLDKLVFVSDYLESGVKASTHKIYSIGIKNINKAYAYCLKETIDYLNINNLTIDKNTLLSYNKYQGDINGDQKTT